MEDMKKLYENKVELLSNELIGCLCKLDGEIEKIYTSSHIVEYKFIYEEQEVFSITNRTLWYEIKVYDHNNGIKFLRVESDNSNISDVYNIMEKKYNEQEEYGDVIEPINRMIRLVASYTNK